MRKTVLFCAAFLFFTGCNRTTEQKPDADRVINDTVAQILLNPFNEPPKAEPIYVRTSVKEDHFLCARNAAIIQLTEALKPPPQRYIIDASMPGAINGALGTSISFEPGCFIDKQGNKVCGPIEVALKECYSFHDLLNQNIATASDEAVIQSKATVQITASSDGENLALNKAGQMNISFPFTNGGKQGYQLFYGSETGDGQTRWLIAPEVPEVNPVTNGTGYEFTKPVFSFHGLGLIDYLHENIRYPDDAKRNELSQKVAVSFVVDQHGKVAKVNINETYKTFKTEIERVLENMPDWQPAVYNDQNTSCVLRINIDFNIRRTDQVSVAFNESEITVLKEKGNTGYMAGDETAGTYTIDRLGWVCLGRYITDSRDKADVIVEDNANANVRLVAANKSTIASGENCLGYTRFKSLPVGSKASIVATRKENGVDYYAIQPIQLKEENIVSLAWRKGNEAMIKKALTMI